MISNALVKKVEDFIVTHIEETDSRKKETISYGIKVLLINLYKIPIIFIVAYILGILRYSIIAYICFSSLRTFAGGIHAERGVNCLLSSMIVIYSPVYFSIYLKRSHNIVLFIITLIIIILYAPSDTKKKPIKSYKLKSNLKKCSILAIIAIFVVSYCVPENISTIMLISLFIESILVSPITYKIFRKERGTYA